MSASLRSPVIRPFAEISPLSERALDAMGFRFTDITLSRDPHGWLLLQVDWTAERDEHKVKYPTLDATSYEGGGGRESESLQLEFTQVHAPHYSPGASPFECSRWAEEHKATIEVGIYIRTGRLLNPPRLSHSYSHFAKTKYGVAVYYQPRGWGRGDYTVLSSWRERRRVAA